MGMEFPAKAFEGVPACENYLTRLAVSYTPAADMTLRQFAFVGQRWNWVKTYDETPTDITTIEWEIRADDSTKPGTAANTLLASGSFDFRYTSVWKIFRILKFVVTLPTALVLTGATKYWIVFKSPSDARYVNNPLLWATTYDIGAGSEVDAAVYCSVFDSNAGTWSAGDNSYNLTLYIASAQAGVQWHVVIDGNGYMTPDKLRGYQCTQGASPLAQSRGGQSEYSQLRFPYTALSQDSWMGGSGQLNMTDGDMTAFLYSLNLDTLVPGQAILGPQLHKTGNSSGTTSVIQYSTSSFKLFRIPGDGAHLTDVRYFAQKFQAGADFTATRIEVKMQTLNYAAWGTKKICLCADSPGDPTNVAAGGLTGWLDITAPTLKFGWHGATINENLTNGTNYWIVVWITPVYFHYGPAAPWKFAFDVGGSAPGGIAEHSPDGTTWTIMTHAGESNSMLFRVNGAYSELSATSTKFAYGEAGGNPYLVCLAGKYVYRWDEGNQYWIDMSTGIMGDGNDLLDANGTDIIFFNNKLFVAQGLSDNARVWDGGGYVFGNWADVGQTVKYWHISHGYLWASTNVSEIKHSNDGAAWSAAIVVGTNLYDITGFIDYSGRFLIGKENGIWDWDVNDVTIEYTRFEGQAHADNCRGWEVWSGMLFIPIQNTAVWRWQPSGYKEVGPTQAQLAGPSSKWANQLTRFASTASRMWASATPMAATGYGGLQVYNGLGWHNYVRHEYANDANNAIFVTTEVGSEYRIWYGEGKRVTYIKLPTFTNNRFDWASADFSTESGFLVTSWWDGGLKDALKFWNRLTIIADLPDNTYINVYLAKDGEDWETTTDMILLGQLTNAQLTAESEYILMFGDYMVAKSIQLVFELGTTDASVTPRIRAYNMECLIRQVPVDIHQFRVLLAKNVTKLDKTTATRTPAQMWEELQRVRAKNNPILVSFPGFTVRGFISHLSRIVDRYTTEGTQKVKWDLIANVAVIEAT